VNASLGWTRRPAGMVEASALAAAGAGPEAGAGRGSGAVRPDEQAAASAVPRANTAAGRMAGCTNRVS
jgi:hypothetical protein